jgi:hypothetical protein
MCGTHTLRQALTWALSDLVSLHGVTAAAAAADDDDNNNNNNNNNSASLPRTSERHQLNSQFAFWSPPSSWHKLNTAVLL